MTKKNFTEAGALYFVATLFNRGIGFITVPIFSRLLTTADYGIVTTFNSWVTMIAIFMSCGLHNAIRNSFVEYEEAERPQFLSTVLTFTCLIFVVSMAVCVVASAFIPVNVNVALLFLCLIQSFGNSLINDYSYFLMMKYQYKARTALMVLPSLLSVIISIFAILFIIKDDLYMGRIFPTTVVYGVVAIVILIVVFSRTKPQLCKRHLKYGLAISLPLILHGVALQILSQSDRMMITALRSASETGIYGLVYNFSMIATVITSSLDGIWVPWFTGKLQNRDVKSINTSVMDYVHLMTYAMVGLMLVSPEILKIFADQRYWEGMSIIPPIILANYLIFMYTLYVNTEHFYKKTVYITVNTLIAASTNLVLNFLFIPKFGYVAAAYTTLVSYLLAFILHSKYAKTIEPDLYPLKMFIPSLLQIGVTIIIYYHMLQYWLIRWGIAFLYVVAMFIKERYRIGVLLPPLSERYAFFREKK